MTDKTELDEFTGALWMGGHLRGAARELRELIGFIEGERDALTSLNDPFSRGGIAALSLTLVHMRQRAGGLERAGRGFDALAHALGIDLPEIQLLEVARLTPDTDVQCNECGHMPTVKATFSDGTSKNTGRCGPCFFGDASYRDPSTWDNVYAKC